MTQESALARDRERVRGALALAAAFGVASLAPAGIMLARATPQTGAPVVVVAPPWTSAAELAVQAGGRLIGPTDAPLGTLAIFDDPGFPERLRAAGAWAAFDGARLAALCGVNDDDSI